MNGFLFRSTFGDHMSNDSLAYCVRNWNASSILTYPPDISRPIVEPLVKIAYIIVTYAAISYLKGSIIYIYCMA